MRVLRGCKCIFRDGGRGFSEDSGTVDQKGSRGPFYVFLFFLIFLQCSCSGYRSTISPRISIGETFTDNRDQTHTSPASDFISTITPGFTYALTGATKALELSYDPSFLFYAKRDGTFASHHNAELNAWDQFAKHSRIEVRDFFQRTDDATPSQQLSFERTDQPTPPTDFTIRQGRQAYYTNFANAKIRHDFGPSDSLFFNFTQSMLKNDDPNLENNNYEEPSLGLTYWFNSRYGMDVQATYTRGDYSVQSGTPSDSINEIRLSQRIMRRFSPTFDVFFQYRHTYADFEGTTPNYHVFEPSLGIEYNLSRTVFLTLSGGYFYQDPERGDAQSGPVVRGDAAKQFSRGAVRLSGGTGYEEAFFGAQNLGFTKYYDVTLSGTYQLARYLFGDASASYRHNKYFDVNSREDDQTTFLAGLRYQFTRWLSGSLNYTYHMVDSTLADESYDENRVTLSFTLAPATPIPIFSGP